MKKMRMRGLVMVCLVTAALMAAVASAQSTQHLSGRVTRVYPLSNGDIYFRLSGTCKTNSYFYFSTASSGGKAWYALLLSAATTKQPVRIAMGSNCDPVMDQPIHYIYQDF
jgi:hypothetical protein